MFNFNVACRYTCDNPSKKAIDMTNPTSPLYNNINLTCLVNGKYDKDITNYGCIGDLGFQQWPIL